MNSRWRRFEILLPLEFNDGREIPSEWLVEAVLEVVDHFGGASYETQRVEGHWRSSGILYRDNLVKLVVDIPDADENREWMKQFKARWMERLEQIDLWMISSEIEVEQSNSSLPSLEAHPSVRNWFHTSSAGWDSCDEGCPK